MTSEDVTPNEFTLMAGVFTGKKLSSIDSLRRGWDNPEVQDRFVGRHAGDADPGREHVRHHRRRVRREVGKHVVREKVHRDEHQHNTGRRDAANVCRNIIGKPFDKAGPRQAIRHGHKSRE
jgi:hypothetical protein